MKFDLIKPSQLTPEHLRAWDALRTQFPEFANPYFSPDFVKAVATIRSDVEIVVLRERERLFGFFPFQREGHQGRPLAARATDYHAVVIDPTAEWSLAEMLTGADLSSFEFDHLLASQSQWQSGIMQTALSYQCHIGSDGAAFLESRRKVHKGRFSTIASLRRRMIRELGPLHFQLEDPDPEALKIMIAWKRAQYQTQGLFDVFSVDWITRLMWELFENPTSNLKGVHATLRAGDTLVAGCFALHSGEVRHEWFCAYDATHRILSPGLQLFVSMLETATAHGIRLVDLGRGSAHYKEIFSDKQIEVAEGFVDLSPMRAALRRSWSAFYSWAHHTPLRKSFRTPGRIVRRAMDAISFR
jgi:CelD/BcsL family acetyltransferase involved in cellulose biosynthesis